MAERDTPEEFDYWFDESADVDESSSDATLSDPADTFQPGGAGSFDAFDSSTWYFEPASPPWYRTRPAATALIAVAAASVAIVVSGVLLVFRGPGTAVDEVTVEGGQVTPTAPSSAVPTQLVTSVEPSPPPPETSAEPVAPPSARTAEPRSPSTRTTKKEPEIGVTRTPETRSPISVAPQRPGGSR